MSWEHPSVLIVSRRDPGHVSAGATLAHAGFEVVVVSPADLVGRMLITLSSDVIVIVDDDLDEEIVVLLKRLATFHREALRVLVGGDPADTQMLRESGILHHHVASFDLETLIPLLRGDREEDDGTHAGRLEADDEVG